MNSLYGLRILAHFCLYHSTNSRTRFAHLFFFLHFPLPSLSQFSSCSAESPCPVVMSRMTTRPANKDKHPGEVDVSPQRRTTTQKRVADNVSAEERQVREETRKNTIRQLAEVEECTSQRLKALMAQGPGPRIDPKDHGRSTTAAKTVKPLAEVSGKHALHVVRKLKEILI